ncbi:MAG: hypothetical protein BGN96_12395 [Bacteroidales bacterium 45-6]|uniref:hypothetical protein n=1 Tax=uncultured Dysgonomonas sp. TaxID=206096 RepID=UPI000960BDC3|nr:hypothetical protein [uncultured Dysgonomonas sp.]OJU55291.1 MAG: hypothetical protein BGN96_12395 [Bacteroidales bacterium 45-6]
MVDRIKITLKDFSGNFEKCKNITKKEFIEYPDRKLYDNFVLRNNTELDKYDLNVPQAIKTKNVTIEGSIRRWNFNNATLLDLTQTSFEKALRNIAKGLNISFDELRQGNVTQCEIGMNVNVSIQAIDILPMVINYNHIERHAERIDEGTLYFIGSEKSAKLYAKSKEIADKSSIIKQERRRTAFKIMQDKGNDFLRIEFTLDDQNAFNHHKMRHIQNLGDLLDNYSDLYRFFVREIKRFVIFNKLSYQEEKLTPKERHIIFGLENFGYETFLEEYRAECIERAKKPRSKISAKSDAFKDIITVLKKYASVEDYNFETFNDDIMKSLFRKSKEEKVDFAELSGILEGK